MLQFISFPLLNLKKAYWACHLWMPPFSLAGWVPFWMGHCHANIKDEFLELLFEFFINFYPFTTKFFMLFMDGPLCLAQSGGYLFGWAFVMLIAA